MALEGAAVFFNGAYFLGPMTLCVVVVWTLLAVLAFTSRNAVLPPTRTTWMTVSLLAALWLWTAVSLTWSIAGDLTWIDFNRTGAFLAIFMVGASVGHDSRARILGAWLFFAAVSVAAIYSLGVKVLPSVVDNLNDLARTSVPIGYTNAQGLLVALAFPLSLFFSAATKYHWTLRLISTLMAPILLVALFFTVSRGATFAILLGVIIFFMAAPVRLRSFGLLLLALVPAALIGWWSNGQDALMMDKADMVGRVAAALTLRLYLLAAVAVSGVVFMVSLLVGRKVRFPARFTRAFGVAMLVAVLVSLTVSTAFFVSSKPSFSGWVQDTYHDFTQVRSAPAGAARLLSVNSSVRWRLWQEAISNWQQHRLLGTGAESFPLVHLMERESDMPFVKQTHGLPFQFLTELGLVGFILAGLFIFTTLGLAVSLLFRIEDRWHRGLAGALLSVVVIYLVHTTYDWDWNIFALTMAYMFFIGVLVGWSATLPWRRVRKGGDVALSKPVSGLEGEGTTGKEAVTV